MSKRKQVQVPIEKIQEQDRFIEAIAEKNSRFYAIHQTKPKYMKLYQCFPVILPAGCFLQDT